MYVITPGPDAEALVPVLQSLEIDGIFAGPEEAVKAAVTPFAAAKGLSIATLPDLRDHRLSLQGNAADDPYLELRFTQRAKARPGAETFNAASGRFKTAVLAVSRRPVVAPLLATSAGLLAALISARDKTFGYAEYQAMASPGLWKITHRRGMPVKIEALEQPSE